MDISNIKNKIALKEVFTNKGYDVVLTDNEIKITPKHQIYSTVDLENSNIPTVKVFDKTLSKEAALNLANEILISADLVSYVESVKNNK